MAERNAKEKAEHAVEWSSDPYNTDDDGKSADDDGNTHCEVQFIESI
jgi:hypothetical protein